MEITLDRDEHVNQKSMLDEEITARRNIDFHHPYTPYPIQEEFMYTVYTVIEEGKVGILESPTGTGKSLSVICGTLTWLRDHKKKVLEEGLNWTPSDSKEPEWVIEQARARKRRELLRSREELEARLTKAREKEKRERERYMRGESQRKRRKPDSDEKILMERDEEFALDDYESEGEGRRGQDDGLGLSKETLALMAKLGGGSISLKDEEVEEEDEIKIFYCSRTHSQLTQFINELRRVDFPPILPPDDDTEKRISEHAVEELKHLTLGSRKNLCINPKVNASGRSSNAINERCLELQQPGAKSDHKCAFLPNKDNQPLINEFRDHSLATIRDIEELGTLGKEIGICPYYASRAAIKSSEIVTLPYPLLLQKSAREALGISLKGHVVVIDEAHNLMDAIAGIHGIMVTLTQLKRARVGLGVYYEKFKNRLKGKNRVYIAQVVRLLDSLKTYLEGKANGKQAEGIVNPTELLSGKGVDQINLYKLQKYLQESKLARKVEGYLLHAEQQQTEIQKSTTNKGRVQTNVPKKQEPATPVLQHIQGLLSALTNLSDEGRIFYNLSEDKSDIHLKYMLLDPTHHFREIVSEARSVILAGGTMSPMSDYSSQLFSYLQPSHITTLSCGHVIPQENMMAWTLSRSTNNMPFEFTFSKRNDPKIIDELGLTLLSILPQIPDGVVIFFPSYNYLSTILTRWQQPPNPNPTTHPNQNQSICTRLSAIKPIFIESKETPNIDSTLREYAQSIASKPSNGSILLSVINGKMSEGINFSDSLARAVFVIGLPFPNPSSASFKAKLEYIESSTVARLTAAYQAENSNTNCNPNSCNKIERQTVAIPEAAKREFHQKAKRESREFYENLTMRAVNQSAGRAIRHRGDYAAIVFVDARYGDERIRGKLPGWIRGGLVEGSESRGPRELGGRLREFFRGKK